ncbi:hypothetical protein AAFF_G00042850 [Aldrovandia affinis]|uniref:Uncharacterized protein n=1 Tax=Aldrovandia affinis TaxID=143900 RepID=A0AAD7S2H7_9TELE|nr:hypothetical protein AAFF_G00042850 [Aldrovandia affinis]
MVVLHRRAMGDRSQSEGSMDSLYEPAHNALEYIIPSRSHSPAVLLEERNKWRSSAPAVPRIAEADEETGISMGTLKRIQKMVAVKKGSTEEGRATAKTTGHISDLALKDDSPVMSCIGLAKKPEKKPGKEASRQILKSNAAPPVDQMWGSGHQSWSKPSEFTLPWPNSYHTCHRPEYRMYNYDFTLPRGKDWNKCEYLFHNPRLELSPPPFRPLHHRSGYLGPPGE